MSPAKAAAVLLAILTVATACGNDVETPSETGLSEVVPVQTASATPTRAATPTPVPTAEPTPIMTTGKCSDKRQNAGLEYEFDRSMMTRVEAADEFCGAIRSAWVRHDDVDRLTGVKLMYADSIAVEHDSELQFEAAVLRLLCVSDNQKSDLLIFVRPAGEFVTGFRNGVRSPDAKVAYRFNNNRLVEDYWQVDSAELLVQYPSTHRQFVRALRNGGELIFRGWTSRDSAITMTFDLTGVDRDVEPVLDQCGY